MKNMTMFIIGLSAGLLIQNDRVQKIARKLVNSTADKVDNWLNNDRENSLEGK